MLAGVTMPRFTEHCIACGICTRTCPGKALHVIRTDDDRFYMAHLPRSCRGCGLCEVMCMFQGIDGYRDIRTPDINAPETFLTGAHPCEICGNVAPAGELCFSCAARLRRGNV